MKSKIAFKLRLLAVYCLAWSCCACLVASDRESTVPENQASEQEVDTLSLTELKAAGAKRSAAGKLPMRREVPATPPAPQLAKFENKIESLLMDACIDCHGPDTQEGGLRIDKLNPDLLHGPDVAWWLEVYGVISNGEMPPADASELADTDRRHIIEWLSSEIQNASQFRRLQQEHTSFRRLTRYEYNFALQDLLELPFEFATDLPPEPASADGFQNSADMLHVSAMQLGYYRQIARRALQRATVTATVKPEPLYWSVSMHEAVEQQRERHQAEIDRKKEQFKDDPAKLAQQLAQLDQRLRATPRGSYYKNLRNGEMFKANWSYRGAKYAWPPQHTAPSSPTVSSHVVIIPPQQKLIVELGNEVPDEGLLRVRIRAARTRTRPRDAPSLRLEFGFQASNNSAASKRISGQDKAILASPSDPQIYEWEIPLSEITLRNPMRKTAQMGKTPNPSEYLKLCNNAASEGDLQIDYIEVTAPVYKSWPPASHRRVLGEFRTTLLSDDTTPHDEQLATGVLEDFMQRAWRAPVTAKEIDQKLHLYRKMLLECENQGEALLEVLATVLASPRFLYVAPQAITTEVSSDPKSNQLSDLALAMRLSLFLWCSLPDEELLELAERKALHDPVVLDEQLERMLADSKSQRFAQQFVRQWLGLESLDYLEVDRELYPEFNPALKEAMQEEPVQLFQEILSTNSSILDFLHCDYAMLNERLARHYGIPEVYGHDFRKVSLDTDHARGGLLTQAGLLAMNSDGKDSHPLKRGIWMLDNLLNDPPPPPPPAVPEIDLADPEIAKLTLKERLEDHRSDPACMSCHSKLDPWGIAFENYDAVGGWRTDIAGAPVDSSAWLFNQQKLEGMDGLKRFLLWNRQDQFARALVHKMATYGLGRPLTFGDRAAIDKITLDLRQQKDGLKTLVKLLVHSELFQSL